MGTERDLQRADWEGMTSSDNVVTSEMSSFFVRVKAAFDSNHSYTDFADAASAVLLQMDSESISSLGIIFDRSNPKEFENGQAKHLLNIFKEHIGEKKWIRFEMESAKRHLSEEMYHSSTPG